jgi:hypothetical protein
MAKNYKEIDYFLIRPEITKIFDDLEAFHDFCRMELFPFDESHLYNRESWVWRNYEKSKRPKKPHEGNGTNNNNRHSKPWHKGNRR